ncbi:MAG: aminotransferase class V-fold PLP-dependent enzyme [Methanomassiliicoccaceae archaeon]|nr:aminotransferase class V-fold PLP-dependent enzyme [Methanomassiliicoccaceae archaeon]
MDVSRIRRDFPTLRSGNDVYLDSACQTLRPYQVIDAITSYYNEFPACGGRSVHSMATKVSMSVDRSRETVASFFGCGDPHNFIFTKNCTEAMNIVANGLGLRKGDSVLTTDMEHNSNHVQWVEMAKNAGIKRKIVRTSLRGEFDIEAFKKELTRDVKLVSMVHTSNVTGSSVPVKDITETAHDIGAAVLIDGAQAAPHMPVNLKELDVDFYALSMHKMLGPSGVGILYGKEERLKELRPLIYGGGTVGLATYDSVKLTSHPDKFEAGLMDYAGIIGTAAALDYLSEIGMSSIEKHVCGLQKIIGRELRDVDAIVTVGPDEASERGGIFSFNIKGMNSHDIAMMLDNADNIMIRSGMHCAHPFFVSRSMDGCARASLYVYNNEEDVMRFTSAVKKLAATFSR